MVESSSIVGSHGKVVGIDLVEITTALPKNAIFFQSDMLDEKMPDKITNALGKKADVVISDASPKLTGIAFRDAANWEELAIIAFEISFEILKNGGNFLLKAFTCPEADGLRKQLQNHFKTVKSYVPPASRKGSKEFYIIALGFLGNS